MIYEIEKACQPENAHHAHNLIPGSELHWMLGSHLAFFLKEGNTAPTYTLKWLRGNDPSAQPPEPLSLSRGSLQISQ